jgi:hypothetical protein
MDLPSGCRKYATGHYVGAGPSQMKDVMAKGYSLLKTCSFKEGAM